MRQGLFNSKTLEMKFGGELSKPHNIFTATAIKVPTHTFTSKERICEGGGWYSGHEMVTKTVDNMYLIIRDGVCIGSTVPYHGDLHIKSYLCECNKTARKYLEELGIEYKYLD